MAEPSSATDSGFSPRPSKLTQGSLEVNNGADDQNKMSRQLYLDETMYYCLAFAMVEASYFMAH